jgi:hypothetical protein
VVKKSPKLLSVLFGDEAVPSKHSSLFYYGQPSLHILLFRVHLLVRSIFIAVFAAVIVPEIWRDYGALVAMAVIFLSLTMIVWEYMFVLRDLITTMCHVSCCGMLRKAHIQDEVLRHQKTRRAVRAVMMMTSLVSHASHTTTCDTSKEERDILLHSVSQAEKNDIGHIFDMYDDDGTFIITVLINVVILLSAIYYASISMLL